MATGKGGGAGEGARAKLARGCSRSRNTCTASASLPDRLPELRATPAVTTSGEEEEIICSSYWPRLLRSMRRTAPESPREPSTGKTRGHLVSGSRHRLQFHGKNTCALGPSRESTTVRNAKQSRQCCQVRELLNRWNTLGPQCARTALSGPLLLCLPHGVLAEHAEETRPGLRFRALGRLRPLARQPRPGQLLLAQIL